MPADRRSASSVAGAFVLAGLVAALPLWRGGAPWQPILAATVLAPFALALSAQASTRLPLAALALSLVLAVLVFQLLPVPAVLHQLSPHTASAFALALGPLGRYPAARPFSLDPAATGLALAQAVAGLAAFVTAWLAGGGRQRRALLVQALGIAGLAVALIAIGASALGASPVLGPAFPFVNRNHLAGFLSLTVFVVLGLVLRSHGQARLLWLLGFIAAAGELLLTLSRGGIATFAGGCILFGFLARRRDRQVGDPAPRWRLPFLAGVVGALAIASYMALDPVVQRLATLRRLDTEVKLSLLAPATAMIRDRPLLGVGRGAFEAAFPAYKTDAIQLTFTHLENEWVQPLVELGVPAGLILIGTLAAAWLFAAQRRDLGWSDIGLLAGTAAVAAQNVVDFSLELPGVAVPFMVALGLAMRGGGPTVVVHRRLLRVLATSLASLGVGGAVVWLSQPGHPPSWPAGEAPEAVAARAGTSVAWRPTDYLPHAVVGGRLVEDGRCGEGMPWLTRAMLLNPTAPEPHLMVARCLAASGQGVLARREYRLAYVHGMLTALAEAAGLYEAPEELLQVAPDSPDGLMALGDLLATQRPAVAAVAYRRALDEYGERRALVRLGRALRAAGEGSEALPFAHRSTEEVPGDPEGWRLAADLLLDDGDEVGALEQARRGLAVTPGAMPLQLFLVERAVAKHRPVEAKRLAEEILPRSVDEQVTKELTISQALALQGRMPEAIERAQGAVAIHPGSLHALLTVALYCEQTKRYEEAIAALQRAATLPGLQAEAFQSRIARLREAKATQEERRRMEELLR